MQVVSPVRPSSNQTSIDDIGRDAQQRPTIVMRGKRCVINSYCCCIAEICCAKLLPRTTRGEVCSKNNFQADVFIGCVLRANFLSPSGLGWCPSTVVTAPFARMQPTFGMWWSTEGQIGEGDKCCCLKERTSCHVTSTPIESILPIASLQSKAWHALQTH